VIVRPAAFCLGMTLFLVVPSVVQGNPCLDQFNNGQLVIKELALYENLRDDFGVASARDDWHRATVAFRDMLRAGVAGSADERISCDSPTNASFFYAAAWYDIDAIGNGTLKPSLDLLKALKGEISEARTYEDSYQQSPSDPSIDTLKASSVRFLVLSTTITIPRITKATSESCWSIGLCTSRKSL
jgi:hypothetical protein